MTRITPHQQHIAMSRTDIKCSIGYCAIPTAKVQLLALRYGLIEPGAATDNAPAPYSLKTRPVGLRLMRNGYLYVLNHATHQLHEYKMEEGSIDDEHPMLFARNAVLYVNYSQTQWSLKKCAQVTASPADRLHFMQRIDLGAAKFLVGGDHLYTRNQVEAWLPEVAHYATPRYARKPKQHDPQDAPLPEPETRPYLWESSPLFRDTHIGEFIGQIHDQYIDNTFFMAVHDDLGVMQDLAHYQDRVLEWMDDWAKSGEREGANQRDYVLASYIQALTHIALGELDNVLQNALDPSIKTMAEALAQRPDAERERIRQALSDVINDPQRMVATPDFQQARVRLQEQISEIRHHPQTEPILTLQRQTLLSLYPGLQRITAEFFDTHTHAIWALKTEQTLRLQQQLYGANFGQRGINELIDRDAMDADLASHSAHLKRWNDLLDQITADRVHLLTRDHFHKAAWYYDASDEQQCIAAFANHYACLKDICRTEYADAAVHEWLQSNPHYSRPLFETLALSQQTSLIAQYSTFGNAAYGFLYNVPEAIKQLRGIEEGLLPNLDTLPENTQGLARSVSYLFDSALALGLNRAVETLSQASKNLPLPIHEVLLRHMPKAMYLKLVEAAYHNHVTFILATAKELNALRHEMGNYVQGLENLKRLNNLRRQYTYPNGERHIKAGEYQQRTTALRQDLSLYSARFAQALSPFGEHPNEPVMRRTDETVSRSGLRINLPKAQQLEAEKMMHSLRAGYEGTSTLGKLGDGLGLLVFFVQLVNLWQVNEEIRNVPGDPKEKERLYSSFAATSYAGFSIAQSITNNGLNNRARQLKGIAQNGAINNIYITMSKLNLTLGGLGYLFGIWASSMGYSINKKNVAHSLLGKNLNALMAARLSLLGSTGQLGASLYGGVMTSTVLIDSIIKFGDPEKIKSVLIKNGPALYKAFGRTTIIGTLFTAIEWIGTWLYNRFNTTPHDEWLLTTPWGLDTTRRQSLALKSYQSSLQHIAQTPFAIVVHTHKTKEIMLILPAITLDLLIPPAAAYASHVVRIGAFDIRSRIQDKGHPLETWTAVSERICDRVELISPYPLSLRVLPVRVGQATGFEKQAMVLVVQILTLLEKPKIEGEYELQEYNLWVDLESEGTYQPIAIPYKTQRDELQYLDPLLLVASHQS